MDRVRWIAAMYATGVQCIVAHAQSLGPTIAGWMPCAVGKNKNAKILWCWSARVLTVQRNYSSCAETVVVNNGALHFPSNASTALKRAHNTDDHV